MIRYKCTSCHAKLETEDAVAGLAEPCPVCGHANHVPGENPIDTAAKGRAKEAAAKGAARERQQGELATDLEDQVQRFFSKVAGVSHPNRDGTDRQEIIRRCREGEPLTLSREEDNPVDPLAVKVCRENGEQLGYLPSRTAHDVVRDMRQGWEFVAMIRQITGGMAGKRTRGVNLGVSGVGPVLFKRMKAMSDRDACALYREILERSEGTEPGARKAGCLGPAAAAVAALGLAAWAMASAMP